VISFPAAVDGGCGGGRIEQLLFKLERKIFLILSSVKESEQRDDSSGVLCPRWPMSKEKREAEPGRVSIPLRHTSNAGELFSYLCLWISAGFSAPLSTADGEEK
jgi:hypothetical protein